MKPDDRAPVTPRRLRELRQRLNASEIRYGLTSPEAVQARRELYPDDVRVRAHLRAGTRGVRSHRRAVIAARRPDGTFETFGSYDSVAEAEAHINDTYVAYRAADGSLRKAPLSVHVLD